MPLKWYQLCRVQEVSLGFWFATYLFQLLTYCCYVGAVRSLLVVRIGVV